jgi:hypothetical protein
VRFNAKNISFIFVLIDISWNEDNGGRCGSRPPAS